MPGVRKITATGIPPHALESAKAVKHSWWSLATIAVGAAPEACSWEIVDFPNFASPPTRALNDRGLGQGWIM